MITPENSVRILKEFKTELAHLRLSVNVITKTEYVNTVKKLERLVDEADIEIGNLFTELKNKDKK